jgi:hypothetical protein
MGGSQNAHSIDNTVVNHCNILKLQVFIGGTKNAALILSGDGKSLCDKFPLQSSNRKESGVSVRALVTDESDAGLPVVEALYFSR